MLVGKKYFLLDKVMLLIWVIFFVCDKFYFFFFVFGGFCVLELFYFFVIDVCIKFDGVVEVVFGYLEIGFY